MTIIELLSSLFLFCVLGFAGLEAEGGLGLGLESGVLDFKGGRPTLRFGSSSALLLGLFLGACLT